MGDTKIVTDLPDNIVFISSHYYSDVLKKWVFMSSFWDMNTGTKKREVIHSNQAETILFHYNYLVEVGMV